MNDKEFSEQIFFALKKLVKFEDKGIYVEIIFDLAFPYKLIYMKDRALFYYKSDTYLSANTEMLLGDLKRFHLNDIYRRVLFNLDLFSHRQLPPILKLKIPKHWLFQFFS